MQLLTYFIFTISVTFYYGAILDKETINNHL